jgi:hypothetical protein
MIPTWLLRRLEDAGRLDADGTRRTVRTVTCRCGAAVLAGLDADRCALAVLVDPAPVDVRGEALAVLAGRSTYDLHGLELDRRDVWRLAGPRRAPVLAEHRCGAVPLPAAEMEMHSRLADFSDSPGF